MNKLLLIRVGVELEGVLRRVMNSKSQSCHQIKVTVSHISSSLNRKKEIYEE